MSDEELEPTNEAASGEEYDLMLRLDRLESLREDLVENNLRSLNEVEAALALLAPSPDPANQERRDLLADLRTEMLDLDLPSLETLEDEIDRLNDRLDNLDEK